MNDPSTSIGAALGQRVTGANVEREFKFLPDSLSRKRELRARLVSWGVVVLLFATTVLLFALRVNGLLRRYPIFGYLFVFSLLAGIIGAIILTCRQSLRRAERQMVFVLDEQGITRKRPRFPDIRIDFSEIATLGEELRWLVICSAEPRRKIAIPNEVKGFDEIRAELAKHHTLSARAGLPRTSIALPTIAVLSWAALFFFRDGRVAIPAGIVAMTSLAIGSHRLWLLLRRGPKRQALWVCLSAVWFSAILLIYLRLVQA